MLWVDRKSYKRHPFDREAELEDAILTLGSFIFGENRYYLDAKRKIGAKGKTRNIPDGYLLDFSSAKQPRLFVVENELAKHDPLRHIAVQILEFSLSFETAPHTVKGIIKEALLIRPEVVRECEAYAKRNGFENIDYLLERMVYGDDKFNALVIIDELDPELETVLNSKFKFPVEILTLERYKGEDGRAAFHFDPFLEDLVLPVTPGAPGAISTLDPSDIDTIVVPARKEGFSSVFIGENRWYQIRIHTSMIPKLKYCAVYQVAPVSAITHVAPISSIEQWQDSNKYVVNFSEPAKPIGPIKLIPKSHVKALYASRYTNYERLKKAKNLDGAF
jgi:hypothetical protein